MNRHLGPEDFTSFFRSLHGSHPFPWQERLVSEVAAHGHWPDLLDLPTGAGKTATIDIAVFLMALRQDAPRRVVFVVDRRVIVHQAAQRARRIAAALRAPVDPVVRAVAECLTGRAAPVQPAPSSPLVCAELRGGIARDEMWALRPDTPAVLVSTVDQVGSRLLFRGYGITRGMRPVHAGLLANDALFLLDEVHLSRPFAQTLHALRERYRAPAVCGLPDQWHVVELSATPGSDIEGQRVFILDPQVDLDATRSPVLTRRVGASKPVRKRLVRGRGRDAAARVHLAEACTEEARQVVASDGCRTAAVVVNRVDTARSVYRLLAGYPSATVLLLTGRMRQFDREDLLAQHEHRLVTGRARRPEDDRMIVVSTQAIEVGADFDFDGLVTECASLDALRQRFGRVDRDGKLAEAGAPSSSVILALAPDVAHDANDPVYGGALSATWRWLEGVQDFGVQMVATPTQEEVPRLLAPRLDAPSLLPSHLDRWVQTSPPPIADPEVAPWLHGIGHEEVDVTLVWRADLTRELLESESGEEAAPHLAEACPPGAGEAMQVPVTAARRWLASLSHVAAAPSEAEVADVEGAQPAVAPPETSLPMAPVLSWRGDDTRLITRPSEVRPGDTLMVPASYGGITAGTWDPEASDAVADYGTRVELEQRRRATLRLAPPLLPASLPPPPLPEDVDELELDEEEEIGTWLKGADASLAGRGALGAVVSALLHDQRRVVTRLRVDVPGHDRRIRWIFAISSTVPTRRLDELEGGETVDSEPGTSSFTGVPVTLDRHLHDVETWARALGQACGLPDVLADDLALAARFHDLGKADRRFQLILRQGRVTGDGGAVLAKSGLPSLDRAGRQRLAALAGYPLGTRHELLSVALVQQHEDLRQRAHDWDLVLHLVASHHGHARPFVPIAVDERPVEVAVDVDGKTLSHSSRHLLARVDSGVPQRFWRLVRRFGWFGLAWLEAILRLADHRASEVEQRGKAVR